MNLPSVYNKIPAQTLFLGASIVNFSTNIGWGGNNSSLTIELIEDFQPTRFANIPHYTNHYDVDNHYYNCNSDESCYVDELGRPYVEERPSFVDGMRDDPKEKNVAGKIYYEWVNNRFVSKYWRLEDPGFFATGTQIDPNGIRTNSRNHIYDIVNTPVYFKFGDFEFIGLVKNCERNNKPGGITYSVTLESFDELLDNCHIILQSFNGAIFNTNSNILQGILDDLGDAGIASTVNLQQNQIGGPVNFPLPDVPVGVTPKFDGKIKFGNLPNVFNVYGFLESFGINGFGGSKLNSEGLRANDILDSIQVLTSSDNVHSRLSDKAFSPFGRILTKNITNASNGLVVTNLKSFGIISYNSPSRSSTNPAQNYNSFKLDLSNLPRPPDNYRIQGNPSISISAFIKQLADDSGVDLLSVVVPVFGGNHTDFIIKIITVDRTNYSPIYQIPSIVSDLERNNFKIENSSFGQEKNNNTTRKLVFGGNQQRLYQVKNYRLSYHQNNLVYNPITRQFISLNNSSLKNRINKIRNPELSSTRNKILSDFTNASETNIFLRDDNDAATRFSQPIDTWSDIELGRRENIIRGNYKNTIIENSTPIPASPQERFISLSEDVISPYFGLKSETNFPVGDNTNEFRYPRPVFLDTWTHQITIIFSLDELPTLSIGEPLSIYDPSLLSGPAATGVFNQGLQAKNPSITSSTSSSPNPTDFGGPASSGINPTRTLNFTFPGFTIKESELRCANIDSYLTYCLGKSLYSKPDLFMMLVNAYKAKGIFLTSPSVPTSPDTGPGVAGKSGAITSSINTSDQQIPSSPIAGLRSKMDINWDLYLNHNFIKDLQIIFSFIKNISDTYYGKKYAIKAPILYAYKDTQYANTQIPSSIGNISVFQGSNEIFYDYEVVDGAWEEYGNYIDDSIVCGDNNWHVLRNDEGLIPTILGYNNSSNIDDLTRHWCELSVQDQANLLLSKGFYILNSETQQYELRRLIRDNIACSNPNKINIPSINIASLEPGSYVNIPKNIQNTDAFNRTVPSYKIYIKTNSDKIVFTNPINLSGPRIIVDSPGISLSNASYSYSTDPNLSVLSNIALEDYCIYIRNNQNFIQNGTLSTQIEDKELQYLNYLLSFVSPLSTNINTLVPRGPSTNSSIGNQSLNPKMATPFFAAIPLKSNRAVYGPWTNYPGLVMNTNLADNLIGKTKIEQNMDYVPWKYGGMSFLDKVISYEMNVDVNYQNTIENGRVSIIGPPVFGIGGIFSYNYIVSLNLNRTNSNYIIYDNSFYEKSSNSIIFMDSNTGALLTYNNIKLIPASYGSNSLISNISIQTSSDGVKTSYSLQTYSPKTGLFNKQFSDNIKKQNSQLLKFNKLLFGKSNQNINKNLQNILNIKENAKTSREPYSIAKNATSLFGNSPVELIVGQADGFSPFPTGTRTIAEFNNSFRNHHWAGIIPGIETGAELLNDYDCKAAMSLDGLLSPVSFYPTRQNTTYSISDHSIKSNPSTTAICPRCSNNRKINIKYIDYSVDARTSTEIEIACPICSKSITQVVSNDKNPNRDIGLPDINLYSLNPIIVSSGEFKNPYAISGDMPKHNILALARGNMLPTGDRSFLTYSNSGVYDYNAFDTDVSASLLMNQRFFALRGPIMLHSWGFDTEGYPVPNATGQPYSLDEYNRPLRFVLNTGTMQNDLNISGLYVPGDNQRLGDIVPVNYTWNGSKYIKTSNKKSKFFLKKWGERPDLWPVGPIDLRWDEKRRVWDASGGGCKEEILPPFIVSDKNDITTLQEFLENRTQNKCPYKMVYVTLEQDMIKQDSFESTNPARAFIDDIEYSKEPLQINYRRLVYVIDTAGYTAPRGAKLLCRYNRDNGFYEPITKPILTALGNITGNQASIQMSYTQARRAGTIPTHVTNFDDPLNLKKDGRGLFNYINGKWTLISVG